MSVRIRRQVILRSIVTDQLKANLSRELDDAIAEIDDRLNQLDAQTRLYITELQRVDLQQAMTVRKRVEAEKKRQEEIRDALRERKQQVEVLDNGTEVIRGTLESDVEVSEGDDLSVLLGGTEIVTKDDIVIEIRLRETLGDDGATDLTIPTQLSQDVQT
ncbi:MAG TPA: hypothetical protein DGT21_08415 [Armatimonadetes bacterium]|nr:hypothetical protein [Armatimonadota bacterium]